MYPSATGAARCAETDADWAAEPDAPASTITLRSDAVGSENVSLRLLAQGSEAFARIIELTRLAREHIEVRAFLWRDDDTGNELAHELLRAADRGVTVNICKDRIGANYELIAGSQQSFFHKDAGAGQRIRTWFLATVYPGCGKSRQQTNELASAICQHPNVHMDLGKRFDHAKLFVFDGRHIVLGSMGIGDNHRHQWADVMVELEGKTLVRRLRARMRGAAFDPRRTIDFLIHSRDVHGQCGCPMLADRLALIASARQRLTIEMAYLGDRRFTESLQRAVRRGVEVTLVTSARADLLGDLNLATCDALLRSSPEAANLRVFLHPTMIHSKIVVIDGQICDVGSANFTRLSHGVYDEVNLYVKDRAFASALEGLVAERLADCHLAWPRIRYRRLASQLERAFIAFFARRASTGRASTG